MLQRYDLGNEGLTYLQSQLYGWRGLALSRYLLEIPLEKGSVYTYLPAGVEPRLLYAFGGAVASPREILPWIVDFVVHYLRSPGRRFGLYQTTESADDPNLSADLPNHITCEGHVYAVVKPSAIDTEQMVRRALSMTPIQFLIGALTYLPGEMADLEMGSSVSKSAMRSMADAAQHITVGAYDDEAFVVWSRAE